MRGRAAPKMAAQNSQGDSGNTCPGLETNKRHHHLQDALQQLPPEIHHKMLPASRTIALRRTSKTMWTAIEKADAVVQARAGIPVPPKYLYSDMHRTGQQFPDGQGLVDKLNGLSMWCKVKVLRLKDCRLGRTGAVRLAEAIASFLSASLVELRLEWNAIQEGGGRALAETLRLNTTLTLLNLNRNCLGEGGGQALAETLCASTPRSRRSTSQRMTWEKAEGRRWQRHCA